MRLFLLVAIAYVASCSPISSAAICDACTGTSRVCSDTQSSKLISGKTIRYQAASQCCASGDVGSAADCTHCADSEAANTAACFLEYGPRGAWVATGSVLATPVTVKSGKSKTWNGSSVFTASQYVGYEINSIWQSSEYEYEWELTTGSTTQLDLHVWVYNSDGTSTNYST